ncbi:MAG: serine hydrolase [Gemmatimonadota bacterium]
MQPRTRRRLATLFLPALAALAAPARAHNGSVAIAYPVRGITVDGDLTDWPAARQTYPVARLEYGSAPADTLDLQAWFRVGYDAGSLYVAVEVRDDAAIVDTTDEWNTQDGCEVFVDLSHRPGDSPCVQHVVYGTHHDVYRGGGAKAELGSGELGIQRAAGLHQYEWRIDAAQLTGQQAPLRAGMVVGLDVAVTDRDSGGAFSWVPWGRGIGKLNAPERRGDLILASAADGVGQVRGRVRWQRAAEGLPPRRVRLQLVSDPERFWVQLNTDSSGAFSTALPAGKYRAGAVDVRVPARDSQKRDFAVRDGREEQVKELVVKAARDRGELVDQLLAQLGPADPGVVVLVARDGQVLHRRGYGMANVELGVPITPETKFRLASVSKQFTAVAVMQLAERGLIDIDAPINRYLADYPNGDRITTRQLMAHTSGVPNYLSMSEFWEISSKGRDLPGLIGVWRDRPLDFEPGSRWSYSNSGFVLLAYMVEQVSGQPFARYLQEHIFGPLGMQDTGEVDQSTILPGRASGYLLDGDRLINPDFLDFDLAIGTAGLYSTVDDLLKWDEALYTDQVISPATRQAVFSRQKLNDGSETTYGLGWRVGQQNGLPEIGHSGLLNGFTSRANRYPDQHFLVVVLCNNPRLYPADLAAQIAEIYLADKLVCPAPD